MSVELSALTIGAKLGKGGFAEIFDLPNHRIAGDTGPYVFKRYNSLVLDKHPALGFTLTYLIQQRAAMSDTERKVLDFRTIWPLEAITDHGRTVGLIMRRLPDQFFFMLKQHRGSQRKPRHMGHYFCGLKRLTDKGLTRLDDRVKVMALARLCDQMAFLHAKGFIIGDIQGGNAVIDPGNNSEKLVRVFMYDSDSYRTKKSVPAVPQANVIGWNPPENVDAETEAKKWPVGHQRRLELEAMALVQTQSTDVYKFGLFVARFLANRDGVTTLTRGDFVRSATTPILGQRRSATIVDAVCAKPADRPSMADMYLAVAGGPWKNRALSA